MQHFYITVLSVIIVLVSMAEASSMREHDNNDGHADVSDHVDIQRRMQQLHQHSV